MRLGDGFPDSKRQAGLHTSGTVSCGTPRSVPSAPPRLLSIPWCSQRSRCSISVALPTWDRPPLGLASIPVRRLATRFAVNLDGRLDCRTRQRPVATLIRVCRRGRVCSGAFVAGLDKKMKRSENASFSKGGG